MTKLPSLKSLDWCYMHPISVELFKFIRHREKVIDLGCGRGQRTYLVATDKDVEITGTDLNLEGIKFAVKNYQKPNLNFVYSDLNKLPFKNEFDSAFMLAVIEHIEDTDNILREIKNILSPNNGRLFISVTDRGYHHDESDIHIFSKDSLKLILERYYTIVNIYIKAHTIFVECHV